MKRYQPLTKEEFTEFLKKIGIRPEGIQAILKTFISEDQYGKMKWLIEERMKVGQPAKEATRSTWLHHHFAQQAWKIPIGPKPTEEDISKL